MRSLAFSRLAADAALPVTALLLIGVGCYVVAGVGWSFVVVGGLMWLDLLWGSRR